MSVVPRISTPHVGALVVALALGGCFSARSPSWSSPGRGLGGQTYGGASASGWRVFRVAEAIDVSLPKPPQTQREQRRGRDGSVIVTTSAESALASPRIAFHVYVTEFEGGLSGDLTDQLDDLVDAFIEGAEDAEVHDAHRLVTRGFPGIELELRSADAQTVLRIRHYVGRKRAYAIGVTYSASMGASGSDTATAFLDRAVLDAADAPVPAGDGRLDTESWQTIFPPADDFAIAMPGRAATETVPFELADDGQETNVYRVRRENDATRFEIRVTPLGTLEREGLLERLRDRPLATGLRIREARDAQRQGFAGLAVAYESGTEVVYCLYVLTLGRVYEARVTVPLGAEAAMAPHRQRFFQSLRIL